MSASSTSPVCSTYENLMDAPNHYNKTMKWEDEQHIIAASVSIKIKKSPPISVDTILSQH